MTNTRFTVKNLYLYRMKTCYMWIVYDESYTV